MSSNICQTFGYFPEDSFTWKVADFFFSDCKIGSSFYLWTGSEKFISGLADSALLRACPPGLNKHWCNSMATVGYNCSCMYSEFILALTLYKISPCSHIIAFHELHVHFFCFFTSLKLFFGCIALGVLTAKQVILLTFFTRSFYTVWNVFCKRARGLELLLNQLSFSPVLGQLYQRIPTNLFKNRFYFFLNRICLNLEKVRGEECIATLTLCQICFTTNESTLYNVKLLSSELPFVQYVQHIYYTNGNYSHVYPWLPGIYSILPLSFLLRA